MSKIDYIAPEVTLHYCEVERGFAMSDPTGTNFGIGGWGTDNNDYGGDAE